MMRDSKSEMIEFFYDRGVSDFTFNAPLGSIGAKKYKVENQKKIHTIQLFIHGEKTKIHILDRYFHSIYYQEIQPMKDPSWFVEDVSRNRILVDGEFFIGVEWINENFLLGVDKTGPFFNNSYLGRIGNPGLPKKNENYMIRVSVCEPFEYDAFICHASEDKEDFVKPLAEALIEEGLKIWYDEFTLKIGDSLRRSIDKGILNSHYGIVVLSKNFFEKEWPQKELDGLVSREDGKEKVILPIWHGISKNEVKKYSPLLADKIAVSSSEGLEYVLRELLRVLEAEYYFEHLYAVFFYPDDVSWESGNRDPYKNMPRYKAIINTKTNKAFYMAEFAQNLFLVRARRKIQFITDTWINEEHFNNWFKKKGINLIPKPAYKSDLLD